MLMVNSKNIFKTLSDRNRLQILKILQLRSSLCVCEITSVLEIGTSTVSAHLAILKMDGFIIDEKDGKWVNYRINPNPSDRRISAILSDLDFWIGADLEFFPDQKKIQTAERFMICAK